MPRIEIRTALATDIPYLPRLEHHAVTETVWKMAWAEQGALGASFRPLALPRPLRLAYPRQPERLLDRWQRLDLLLVALHDGQPIGYLAAPPHWSPQTLWVTDLVVHTPWRRQGVGSALVGVAAEWSGAQGYTQMVAEMSFRNGPAIALAQRLGFAFSGFQDAYYPNGDAALFFALPLA